MRSLVKIFSAIIVSPMFIGSATAFDVVGELKGQFAVSPQGSATYSIPIELPEGQGGIKPDLGLSYDSNGGNGPLGVGWSIQGLSQITRCNATTEDDGFRSAQHYDDDSVRLCADGNKLTNINGPYGEDGTQYRGVRDDFSRYTTIGSINSDNESYIEVETKSGDTVIYGGAYASGKRTYANQHVAGDFPTRLPLINFAFQTLPESERQQAMEEVYGDAPSLTEQYQWVAGGIHTWHISSIRGPVGGEINYFYNSTTPEYKEYDIYDFLNDQDASTATAANKVHEVNLLSRVEYPAADGQVYSVVFAYDDRHEIVTGAEGLTRNVLTKRLSSIMVLLGQKELSRYEFFYGISSLTERLKLNEVRRCIDDACLDSTVFTWNYASQPTLTKSTEYDPPADLFENNSQVGALIDVNTDGLPDFISDEVVYLNSGEGWSESSQWELPGAVKDDEITRGYWTDFNNDGQVDYLYLEGSSYTPNLYLNTGNGWQFSEAFGVSISVQNNRLSKHPVIFDLNNDGWVDVVFATSAANTIYLNNECNVSSCTFVQGTSTLLPHMLYSSAGDKPQILFPYDVNFDGLTDLVGESNRGVIATESGWGYGINGYGDFSKGISDINGDGVPDFVGTHIRGTVQAPEFLAETTHYQSRAFRNGVGLINSFGGSNSFYWTDWAGAASHAPVWGDFNGDGRADYIATTPSDGSPKYYRYQSSEDSNGNLIMGYEAKGTAPTSVGFSDAGNPHYGAATAIAMDVNGDGKVDLIKASNLESERGVWLNTGQSGDRIQRITSGMNKVIGITYASSTDETVYEHHDGQDEDFLYPRFPMTLVSKHTTWAKNKLYVYSATPYRTTHYRYGGFAVKKAHLARPGSRGFRWMSAQDEGTGVTEKTWYSQRWPAIGATERVLSYRGDGDGYSSISSCPNSGNNLIACVETDYERVVTESNSYFTVASESRSFAYGEVGELTQSTITTQSPTNDSFGNIETVSVEITNHLLGKTYTKSTTNIYDNDEQRWWLGRLRSASVLHSSPEGNLTKEASFSYSPTTGLLKTEVTEPDATGSSEYLRKEYEYDALGMLEKQVSYGYHHDGTEMLSREIHTNISYSVSAEGVPLKQVVTTNVLGHSETKLFDMRHGGVIEQTSPNGLTTTWEYDHFGRMEREFRADGTETSYIRTWADYTSPTGTQYQITTQSTGSPAVTQYFDTNGKVLRKKHIGLGGRVVLQDTEYDVLGLTVKTSRPYFEGEAANWITLEYDDKQRLSNRTAPGPEGPATTSYQYQSNAVVVNDPHGKSTTTVSDVNGKPVEITDSASGVLYHYYGVTGELIRTVDPIGQETRFQYDAHNRKKWMQDPHMGKWLYFYNSYGELEKQQDAEGNITLLSYDAIGRLVARNELEGQASWQYDFPFGASLSQGLANNSVGKLVEVVAPDGYRKTYQYDELGRPFESVTWHGSESFTLTTEYDGLSRPSVSIRPDGFIVENVYDEFGYLVSIRTPKEIAGDYDLDHLFTVLQQTLAAMDETLLEVQSLQQTIDTYKYYSDWYRTAAESSGMTDQELLDAAAGLDALIIQLEAQVESKMNSAEYLTGRMESYELAMDQTSISSYTVNWSSYYYGYMAERYENYAAARVASAEDVLTDIEARQAEAAVYRDLAGISNVDWRAMEQTLFQYADIYAGYAADKLAQADAARKKAEKLEAHSSLISQNIADDDYAVWWRADETDAEGRVTRSVVGNGLLTERFYNAATGQLDAISTGGTLLSQVQMLSYGYDNLNNVTAVTNDVHGASSAYTYDSLDRVEDWQYQSATSSDADHWTYDGIGNITYSQKYGGYQYNTNALGGAELTGTDHFGAISHDQNGRITDKGDQQYLWTSFGKPHSLDSMSVAQQFSYGPDRARYQQWEHNTGTDAYQRTTQYVGKLYEKITTTRAGVNTTQRKHYLFAGGDMVAVHTRYGEDDGAATTSAQTRYFHKDALGSVTAITDQRANIIAQYRYSPFGEQIEVPVADPLGGAYSTGLEPITTRGYTGHEHLAALNLIHMNGRVYDPVLARFLSADPNIQAPNNGQNYNRYSYVLNNPLKYSDPSGFFFKKIFGFLDKVNPIDRLTTKLLRKYDWFRVAFNVAAAFAGPMGSAMAAAKTSYAMGGSNGDIFRSAAIAWGSAKLAGEVKGEFDPRAEGLSGADLVGVEIGRAVTHGVTQGLATEIGGGNFRDGLISGAGGSLAGHIGIPGAIKGDSYILKAIQTSYVVAIGGTVSQITGGKFANGATTAAYVHLFNALGLGGEQKATNENTQMTRAESRQLSIDLVTGGIGLGKMAAGAATCFLTAGFGCTLGGAALILSGVNDVLSASTGGDLVYRAANVFTGSDRADQISSVMSLTTGGRGFITSAFRVAGEGPGHIVNMMEAIKDMQQGYTGVSQ